MIYYTILASREAAVLAVQRLNGAQLLGRRIRIDLKGAGGPGPTKGKGKGKVVQTFAKPAERRQWVAAPSEDERRAVVDAMRARAVEHLARAEGKRAQEQRGGKSCIVGQKPLLCLCLLCSLLLVVVVVVVIVEVVVVVAAVVVVVAAVVVVVVAAAAAVVLRLLSL